MTLVERFLKYVSFDTQSNEESGVTPSTPGQMVFVRFLKEELEALGLEEITLDENGYLFATLPANIDKSVPVVGFIAHMDTSPDMSGKDVSPRIVENYDGKDIVLCADEQVVLSPARFPELLNIEFMRTQTDFLIGIETDTDFTMFDFRVFFQISYCRNNLRNTGFVIGTQ